MRSKLTAAIVATALFLAACGPSKPSPELQIRLAVAGTLSAIPTPTRGTLPTPYPSPTAFSLTGLFCEYQFCVGHPQDMAFFDLSAQQNPGAPSTYAQGKLLAYNANLVIQMLWQIAPGVTDPNFMLDLILDKEVDTPSGQAAPSLLRDMNTVFEPIQTTTSSVLPFGAAGAWTCGDRAFAWKVYTPDTGSGQALFQDALNRFSCRK